MLTPSTPPLRTYTRLLSRLGWSLLLFFAMFLLSNIVVEVSFEFLPSTPTVRALYGLFSTVAYAAPFILAGLIFSALTKKEAGKHARTVTPPRPVKDRIGLPAFFPLLILAGLAVNLVASEINYYFCILIGYNSPIYYEPVYYDTPASVILYLTTAFAPAFAEEYLFRGVVYGNLRPFGKWQAVIISAITFSLMHQNMAQILYTFVCGIILALMYEWTGSIWCGVFFHLFNNEIAVLSEALVYGAYGESAYNVILAWNGVIVGIGLISAVILIVCAVKNPKKQADAHEASQSIFGAQAASELSVETWDTPVSGRQARRGLCAPGMLTFILYSFGTVMMDYLTVLTAV